MFSIFRKKAKAPISKLPGAAELVDTKLVNTVLSVFQGQSPVTGALFLVAWENLSIYFPVFQKAMMEEPLYPPTYEGMSSFHAAELTKYQSTSLEDEVAKRRLFYMYIACLLKVAHRRASENKQLLDDITNIWLELIPAARCLRATLDQTSLWGREHTEFFDHIRTASGGEKYLMDFLMPKEIQEHSKIIERLGS